MDVILAVSQLRLLFYERGIHDISFGGFWIQRFRGM
jgi:hypothetical protein